MKLAALIVETRPLPTLVKTINDHMKFLPKDTELIILHGLENAYLEKLFPHAKCTTLLGEMTEHRYNTLMTTPAFWHKLSEYSRVLIFQADSMLLRPGIEEFYKWGYIGSPWKFQSSGFNGGLSLRDPKLMLEICNGTKWTTSAGNEDLFFSNILYKGPYPSRMAPREIGMTFGTEAVFSLGTLGFHAIDKWLSPEQCEQIKNQYKNE